MLFTGVTKKFSMVLSESINSLQLDSSLLHLMCANAHTNTLEHMHHWFGMCKRYDAPLLFETRYAKVIF